MTGSAAARCYNANSRPPDRRDDHGRCARFIGAGVTRRETNLRGFDLDYGLVRFPSLLSRSMPPIARHADPVASLPADFHRRRILGIKKRAVLKQKWFLNAMACSLPVHVAAHSRHFLLGQGESRSCLPGFYTVGAVWVAGVSRDGAHRGDHGILGASAIRNLTEWSGGRNRTENPTHGPGITRRRR
jgi:hypothetical protein